MIKRRKITGREWFLVLVFIIIFFGLVADNAIRSTYINFNRLKEEIALNEQKLVKLKAILAKADELNSEYREVFSRYKGPKDSDNLLQEIGSIAKKLNLNILTLKPALAKEEKKYRVYSIKIESQDDISTIAGFLFALTEEQKSIGVQQIQIRAQGRDELPRISLFLNAVIFKDLKYENI